MNSSRQPHSFAHAWTFRFSQLSEEASCALAADLAAIAMVGDCLALDGDLGLGKSTFARAFLKHRANDPCLEVPSPTFTLVQGYSFDGFEVSHFDLYRISDFEELYEIGLEESWQQGCALIEWPDRAEEMLPDNALWLHFEESTNSDARQVVLGGSAQWGERLQRLCEKRQLLVDAGWGDGLIIPIKGDLSPRSYSRITRSPDGEGEEASSAILMDSPAREPGPELADGRLYDLVAHRVTSLAPMVSITQGLSELGLNVPEIFGFDIEKGLMLWQDFGSENLARNAEHPVAEQYQATVAALAILHEQPCPAFFDGSGGVHKLSPYDEAAFRVELDVFVDWYWRLHKGEPCSDDIRHAFHQLWDKPFGLLCDAEQGLVLRDVQSPNCFWLEDGSQGDDAAKVGFIDFQDCLIGPFAYDLAALCQDARVSIDQELEQSLLSAYITQRTLVGQEEVAFRQAYAICAAQRTCKNLGAFARAALSLSRNDYLSHIPRSLDYLTRSLSHPALSEIENFFRNHDLLAEPDAPDGGGK